MQFPHTIRVDVTYSDVILSPLKWAFNTSLIVPIQATCHPKMIADYYCQWTILNPVHTQLHNGALPSRVWIQTPCLRWTIFYIFVSGLWTRAYHFLPLFSSIVLLPVWCFFPWQHVIPTPPLFFCLVTLVQPIIWSFFLSSMEPHKKFLLILSKLAWILLGRIHPCIV